MSWDDDRLEPSKKQYEEFGRGLSTQSSSGALESGLVTFLSLLFLIPLAVLLTACALGMFGELMRGLGLGGILLGVAGFALLQAYRGLVRRKVRVVPKSRIRNETAYVGGRIKEVAEGKAAVVAGGFFLAVGIVSLIAAIWVVIRTFWFV